MIITLNTLLKGSQGQIHGFDQDMDIHGLVIDSRQVGPKTCYFPVLGENFDGHQFILGAFQGGCPLAVCEKAYFYSHYQDLKDKALILVDDSTKALQRLAKYILKLLGPRVIGITGSVGKTSTKEFVYGVLSQVYRVHKNKGNLNNHIGMPLTIFDLEDDHQVAILEMGMNHMHEIDVLADIARPEVAIITNIGKSHIGNLGSQDNIFKAKLEITSYLEEGQALVVNGQDPYLSQVESEVFSVFKVGSKTLELVDKRIRKDGCYSYDFTYEANRYQVNLMVLGEHNIYNSLLAIQAGLLMEVPMETIIKGLEGVRENKGRLDVHELKSNIEIISDCYNASQDSIQSAVDVLMSRNKAHKIAIIGDVLELGDYSEATHRAIGQDLNREGLSVVVLGQESLYTYDELKGDKCHFLDKQALIDHVKSILSEDTSILVKGSFGMGMIEIVEKLIEE